MILLFPALGFSPARAEDSPGIIRIVTPAWPGLADRDGTGLYFDLLRTIYRPAGVKVVYRITPWKRAKEMIRHDKADAMLAAYRTPEKEGWIYPRLAMDVDRVTAVVGSGKLTDWRGPASLKNRRLVWLRGYNFQNYINTPIKWREVDSARQGWLMVAKGRADAYLDVLPAVKDYLKKNPDRAKAFRIEKVMNVKAYLRFADRPRSRKLIEIYDRRLGALLGTPALRELYKSWGQPYPQFNPR